MRRSLTDQERIRKKADFQRLFASPLKASCPGAKLIFSANQTARTRFGVSLVRKYGTAVQRNYAKRLARELYRTNKDQIKDGYDLVLVLYPGEYGYEDRRRQFFALLAKAELLRKLPQPA